jgi:circadian clock protein KaiB
MTGAVRNSDQQRYVLKLYVIGMTARSQQAIYNVYKVCREHCAGNYELSVIDIYQQPDLAKGERIIAVPTLIKKSPLPRRRLVGNFSDTDKVLLGLDMMVGRLATMHEGEAEI